MLTIHLENEGRSARVGLSAPPAEKVMAPLEQVTNSGKIKRVQALNGQNSPSDGKRRAVDGRRS
jgi:hypothetical protein